jgi:hypothetical protein
LRNLSKFVLAISNPNQVSSKIFQFWASFINILPKLDALSLNLKGMKSFKQLDSFFGELDFQNLKCLSFDADLLKMSPNAWKNFIELIISNHSLQSLNLEFQNSNYEYDFPLILKIFQYLSRLEKFSMKFIQSRTLEDKLLAKFAENMLICPMLKDIRIQNKHNKKISEDGVREFGRILSSSNTIENVVLNLEDCNIEDEAVYELYALYPIMTISSIYL